IESFHLDYTTPVWMFAVGGWRVEARVWMEPGEDTTYLAWFLHPSSGDCSRLSLRVTLLVNSRDHHSDTREDRFQPTLSPAGETLHVADGARFTLSLRAPGGKIRPQRDWYHDFDL